MLAGAVGHEARTSSLQPSLFQYRSLYDYVRHALCRIATYLAVSEPVGESPLVATSRIRQTPSSQTGPAPLTSMMAGSIEKTFQAAIDGGKINGAVTM